MGIVIIVAGSMHIALGLQADQMLGAAVSARSISDPGLDSQNRFYGATFTLYGVLLLVISTQLQQYATILRCLLWVFLGAGVVRFISVSLYGWPPLLIGLLFALELIVPVVLLFWFSRFSQQELSSDSS